MKGPFYRVTVSEASGLKTVEDENAKLKKFLAKQMRDLAVMKDLVPIRWNCAPRNVEPLCIFGPSMPCPGNEPRTSSARIAK